jgi:hypothetical protein
MSGHPKSGEFKIPVDRESRRAKVAELLGKCGDQKVLARGSARALEHARKAYRLANDEPRLATPWPQLAAYRLAMLQLRTRECSFEEVDELLAQAAGGIAPTNRSQIGPLPLIYRLAVLKLRLDQCGAKPNSKERRTLLAAVDDTFGMIRSTLARRADYEDKAPLQNTIFNMLELAALFLRRPPADWETLEGLGSFERFGATEVWRLIGTSELISQVRYTRALAEVELEARGAEEPKAILFKFDGRQGQWRFGSQGSWQDMNPDWAKYLRHRLLHPRDAHIRQAIDPNGNPEAFRQMKRRLKIAISTAIGGIIELAPDGEQLTFPVPIYGAVQGG